ncbi:MAG: hypothetical protein V4498_02600 [candidate division FCPU426 bacterium]
MRIVNLKEFLTMPSGTVYSKYEPCAFGPINVKGDSIGEIDFYTWDLAGSIKADGTDEFVERLHRAEKSGEDLETDFDQEGRDGMFQDDQLFAVYSKEDVSKMIARLEGAE